MELFDWNLTAGQSARWYGAARYLRLLECTGTVEIEAEYEAPENDRQGSRMIRGIGVDLSHPISGARVKSINFISSVDQVIQVLVSELPTTDSRLSGAVSVSAGLGILNMDHVSVPAGNSSDVFYNPARRAVIIGVLSTATASLIVGESGGTSATRGMEIQPGTNYRFEVVGPITVFNPSAAAQTFYAVEEL